VEAFSTYRIFSASGVVVSLLLGMMLPYANLLIFIGVLLVGQAIATGTAIYIKDLDPRVNS
jgi:hypothetical protein